MVVLYKFRRTRVGESLSSQCNGTTKTFTTVYDFNPDKIAVYLNGQRLAKNVDFTVTDTDEFQLTHITPRSYYILIVDYERA
jgi:hypothetical protein